jgi:hypothetical protein
MRDAARALPGFQGMSFGFFLDRRYHVAHHSDEQETP